jgi:hypothetical protein
MDTSLIALGFQPTGMALTDPARRRSVVGTGPGRIKCQPSAKLG